MNQNVPLPLFYVEEFTSVITCITGVATRYDSEQLTNRQIVRLAATIPVDDMEVIAVGCMNITYETIKTLQHENRGKSQAFNRAVFKYWANMNPKNQVQVSVWGYFMMLN